jgi:hypothetical protein
VLDSCRYLQQRGFEVTYLPVEKNGLINMQQLADAIRPTTSLVSSMSPGWHHSVKVAYVAAAFSMPKLPLHQLSHHL